MSQEKILSQEAEDHIPASHPSLSSFELCLQSSSVTAQQWPPGVSRLGIHSVFSAFPVLLSLITYWTSWDHFPYVLPGPESSSQGLLLGKIITKPGGSNVSEL